MSGLELHNGFKRCLGLFHTTQLNIDEAQVVVSVNIGRINRHRVGQNGFRFIETPLPLVNQAEVVQRGHMLCIDG